MCLTGRLIRRFVDKPFPALEPNFPLEDGMDLKPYGIPGRVAYAVDRAVIL